MYFWHAFFKDALMPSVLNVKQGSYVIDSLISYALLKLFFYGI